MNMTKGIKELKNIEEQINRHLYSICAVFTVFVMIMTLVEFFSRGFFYPARIELLYLGILVIYALHKEIVRWLGHRENERQGEYFVYVWIGISLLLYVVNFISRDYFRFGIYGESLTILRDVSMLTLQILAIFILTRGLKILRIYLAKRQ